MSFDKVGVLRMCEAGLLGRKTGQGFFSYS